MKLLRMLPASLTALALLSGVLAVPSNAQTAPKRRPRIAVLDFDYATVQTSSSAFFGTNIDVGKGIADLLVTGLVKDGSYSIIERKALDRIMAEQNFSNSNRADPTSAAKLGKLLGVYKLTIRAWEAGRRLPRGRVLKRFYDLAVRCGLVVPQQLG